MIPFIGAVRPEGAEGSESLRAGEVKKLFPCTLCNMFNLPLLRMLLVRRE
jgi:hypothetical protein